jgi:hypothetical protein
MSGGVLLGVALALRASIALNGSFLLQQLGRGRPCASPFGDRPRRCAACSARAYGSPARPPGRPTWACMVNAGV